MSKSPRLRPGAFFCQTAFGNQGRGSVSAQEKASAKAGSYLKEYLEAPGRNTR